MPERAALECLPRRAAQPWFRAVVAGERVALESADGGWNLGPGTGAESVLDGYREEVRRASAIIAATPRRPCPVELRFVEHESLSAVDEFA